MTVIGYMTTNGVFKESVQEGSQPVDKTLIVAPDGWGYGLQYKDGQWVEYQPQVTSVTVKQAMKALGEAQWTMVAQAIEQMPWEIRVDFKASEVWERDNPYVVSLGKQLLGLNDQQLDDLFNYAGTL